MEENAIFSTPIQGRKGTITRSKKLRSKESTGEKERTRQRGK